MQLKRAKYRMISFLFIETVIRLVHLSSPKIINVE